MVSTPLWHNLTNLDVYEPAEDSFLLLDALESDIDQIKRSKPSLCLEIGSGSGVVITALAASIGSSATAYIATDINPQACQATSKTAHLNNVNVECVQTDLVDGLFPRLTGQVDVLLFNPPYVVTSSEEVNQSWIAASWAGGANGTEVLDRLLPSIPHLLAKDGVFYLVVIKENKPEEIVNKLLDYGLSSAETVVSRTVRCEQLSVLRFTN